MLSSSFSLISLEPFLLWSLLWITQPSRRRAAPYSQTMHDLSKMQALAG